MEVHKKTDEEMYTHKSIIILIIASFAFSLHPFIELFVLTWQANWRCILFGQIFEMKREFIDGYMIACWCLFVSLLFSSLLALYHVKLCYKRKSLFQTSFERVLQVTCLITSLLSTILFKAGHFSLCNSLEFSPVCNAETIDNLEFKYFRPKYLDIGYFPYQFHRMTISMILNVICVLLLTIVMMRQTREKVQHNKNKRNVIGF